MPSLQSKFVLDSHNTHTNLHIMSKCLALLLNRDVVVAKTIKNQNFEVKKAEMTLYVMLQTSHSRS